MCAVRKICFYLSIDSADLIKHATFKLHWYVKYDSGNILKSDTISSIQIRASMDVVHVISSLNAQTAHHLIDYYHVLYVASVECYSFIIFCILVSFEHIFCGRMGAPIPSPRFLPVLPDPFSAVLPTHASIFWFNES